MKVRTPFPGKVDDVTYRCEQCGAEVEEPVPGGRGDAQGKTEALLKAQQRGHLNRSSPKKIFLSC